MAEKRKLVWTWIVLISTGLFLLICNLPSLTSSLFTVDDESLIKIPQLGTPLNFRSVEAIFRFNQHIDYYPLRDLSYALDAVLWRDSVILARAHQLFLFWITAVLANFVLLELGVSWLIALFGTVLWAIHPDHLETIVWLSARKDVLALVFGLMAVLFYLKALKVEKNRFYAGALISFLCSLLSKASLTLLPVAAILLFLQKEQKSRSRSARVTLLLALAAGGLSALGQNWFYSHVNDMRLFIPWSLRLETSLIALGKMVSGWFIPSINVVETDTFGEWAGLNHSYLFVGLATWVTFLILSSLALWKRKHGQAVGILTIGLMYFPISGLLFPHRGFYSTRYLEPASLVAWMIFLMTFARQLRPSKKLAAALVLALGVIGALNLREASNWIDPLTIRLNALKKSPLSLSLKSYALTEVVNSIHFGSESERAELRSLRDRLKAELSVQCEELASSGPKTPDSPLINCHPFFRTGFLLSRSHGNWTEADRYFELFGQSMKLLNVAPKMFERMRFENMLLKNSIDLDLINQWLNNNPFLPNSEYRLLNLVGQCLVKKTNQGQFAREAIEKRLLFPHALNEFMNEIVAPPLRPELETCLDLTHH